MESEKIAIFGAGYAGKVCLENNKGKAACFIDNDIKKQGSEIEDIPVISMEEYLSNFSSAKILVPYTNFFCEMKKQLDEIGVENWEIFTEKLAPYRPTDRLVYNPYEFNPEVDESSWINKVSSRKNRHYFLLCYAKQLYAQQPLFEGIEIETYNRCNGVCEFCPVSAGNDTRKEQKMSMELFHKIIDELSAIKYDRRLSLFSNNEPFLDERIIDFHEYARKQCPKARIHLFTNGTKLTLDKFQRIIDYLDELVIDNYNVNLELLPNVKTIKDYCEKYSDLIQKVTIALRNPKEILTTRGGDAPNRKKKVSFPNAGCIRPYTQMIIRPDGKVSLCCNDPLGKNTLGDVSQKSLLDVWYGEEFDKVRKSLLSGRGSLPHCKYCDTQL